MDRNKPGKIEKSEGMESLSARRAWIEMACAITKQFGRLASLSARRAWIEIRRAGWPAGDFCVALRKESVDRNRTTPRRGAGCWVALRKESVDRNMLLIYHTKPVKGRSPQGERG